MVDIAQLNINHTIVAPQRAAEIAHFCDHMITQLYSEASLVWFIMIQANTMYEHRNAIMILIEPALNSW